MSQLSFVRRVLLAAFAAALASSVATTLRGAPTITRQPTGGTVGEGNDLVLSVEATGALPRGYQWYRNEAPLSGEVRSTLWLRDVTAAAAGEYRVVVSDAAGAATSQLAAVQVSSPSALMWTESQFVARRSFHDSAGRVFLLYNQGEPYTNVLGGKLLSRLVRLDEATGAVDPSFTWDDRWGVPTTLAVRADNGLYVGVMLGDKEGGTIVKVDASGARDATFAAPVFDRMIRYLTLQPDGKLLVAFDSVASYAMVASGAVVTGAKALYRLNVDGGIDAAFTPVEIGASTTFTSPPQLDATGRIYLLGPPGPVQGVATQGFFRVDASGAIDAAFPNWASAPGGMSYSSPVFVAYADGATVLAGRFSNVIAGDNGNPVVAIRFTGDGSFDASFQHLRFSDVFPNGSTSIEYPRAIVSAPEGGFAVAGQRFARFAANGALVATGDLEVSPGFLLSRSASTGRFFVSGGANNGASGGVRVFESNGAVFTGFAPGRVGRTPTVRSAIALNDGRILVGGTVDYSGGDRRPGTVLLDSDGRVSSVSTPFHDLQRTLYQPLTNLVQWSDGAFLSFLSARPTPTGDFVTEAARFSAEGARDTAWSGTGSLRTEPGPAGSFFNWTPPYLYSPYSASSSGGATLLRRYNAAGVLDVNFQAELPDVCRLSQDEFNNYSADIGTLLCVCAASDGGAFVALVTYDGALRVVKLRENGSRDPSFNSPMLASWPRSSGNWYSNVEVGPSLSASVLVRTVFTRGVDLAVLPDGSLFVTGTFAPEGRPGGIARLNPDGSFSDGFTGSGLGLQRAGLIPAGTRLALDAAGRVYLAGRFDSVNGHPAPGLVRFSTAGVLDLDWQPGVEVHDDLLEAPVLLARDGWLHVFGQVRHSGRRHTAEYLRTRTDPLPAVTPPQSQTISFDELPDVFFTRAPIALAATSSSGLAVEFSVVSGAASVTGNQLTLLGLGEITVRATQPGNPSWAAAVAVERTFFVRPSFASWLEGNFSAEQIADERIAGVNADTDGDGLVNLVEYALGTDPRSDSSANVPSAAATATDWTFTYSRPADRSGLSYAVERSADLANWSSTGVTHALTSSSNGIETWSASYPIGSSPMCFFRLVVTH